MRRRAWPLWIVLGWLYVMGEVVSLLLPAMARARLGPAQRVSLVCASAAAVSLLAAGTWWLVPKGSRRPGE